MENQELKQAKYSVELKQSARKQWYIGSIRINADTKEILKQDLNEISEIAIQRIKDIEEKAKQEIEKLRKERI